MKVWVLAGVGLATVVTVQVVAGSQAAPEAKASVWDGVYTEEQAGRGEALYKQYCAACHGDGLMGGEMAPGLAGSGFTSAWDNVSLAELFDRTKVTMPQDAPGTLSAQENADVLAYMLKVNQFPAGTTELAREAPMLKGIMLRANKP